MRKDENNWEIGKWEEFETIEGCREVIINDNSYIMTDQMAGLTHAILLLVDAINDKKI